MPEQLSVDREPTEAEKRRLIASTRRFDLRRILGALFLLYGVLTTIVGIVDGAADLKKTGGIAINLWAGIAMLVLGVLFLVWDRLRPVPEEDIVKNLEQDDANRTAAKAEGER
ncbi:MAG: hypothetical protein ACTHJL_05205 [Amnibacterium sp.]